MNVKNDMQHEIINNACRISEQLTEEHAYRVQLLLVLASDDEVRKELLGIGRAALAATEHLLQRRAQDLLNNFSKGALATRAVIMAATELDLEES